MNQVFKEILSQVLAGILADLDEEVGLADEDELIQVITEGKKRKKKRKGETFEVGDEPEDEIFKIRLEDEDEFFQSGDEPEDETLEAEGEDEFFQSGDDESFESLDEETFKVF
ncbi:MAG: hypothetical protein AAB309_01245 [Deltaproteobacteria bacterium]